MSAFRAFVAVSQILGSKFPAKPKGVFYMFKRIMSWGCFNSLAIFALNVELNKEIKAHGSGSRCAGHIRAKITARGGKIKGRH